MQWSPRHAMNSLPPILPSTKGSTFPLYTFPSAAFRPPPLISRPPLVSPPAIANAILRTLASPPRVSPAVRTVSGGSISELSLLWEERIERGIYGCRFLTFFGVLGSLMGSVLCYLKGCVYVMDSFTEYFNRGGKVILMLVEALDIYLIGTVMLVFGMGLYKLFISNFDGAKTSSHGSSLVGLFKLPEMPKWLEIQSVSELKTKVGHVIVLVLLIGLLDKGKKVAISSSKDLLCFSASILLSSGGLYLLSMLQNTR